MLDALAYFIDNYNLNSNYNIEHANYLKKLDDLSNNNMTNFLTALNLSSSPFLSTLTTEENIHLPNSLKTTFTTISNELHFSQHVKDDINKLLIKLYTNNLEKTISLAKTDEEEFVIYITENGVYKNILIDEDGDIELLIIPRDKSKTYHKRFYKEDGLNFSKVINTFNEL